MAKANPSEELKTTWSAVARNLGLRAPPPPIDRTLFDTFHRQSSREARKHFGPWLTTLDVALQHYCALFLSGRRRDPWFTPFLVLGKACAHANAIRRLVLSGFNSSAVVVQRTLNDALAIYIFCLTDEQFRTKFVEAVDEAAAYRFWQTELRYGKMHKRLREIETQIGFDADLCDDLEAHRQEELQRSSTYVHSLIRPAMFSAYVPAVAEPGWLRAGVFGRASFESIRTLDETIKTLWYFATIGFHLLLEPLPKSGLPPYEFKKRQELDRNAVVAFHTFSKLAVAHWNDVNNYSFPDEPPKRRRRRPTRRSTRRADADGRPRVNAMALAGPTETADPARPRARIR